MADEKLGYPMKEPALKKGGMKDEKAYSEKVNGAAQGARKGAPLDSKGGVAKKDEPIYKEACKDE